MHRLVFALNDMESKIGLVPHDTQQISADITGNYERFRILGESCGKKSGAILFFDDGGYWAMNHKTGKKCYGYPGNEASTPQSKKQHAIKKSTKNQEHQEKQDYLRKVAMHIYSQGHPVEVTFLDGHPYLNKKNISTTGILSCQDCHMEYRRDWLMFPLLDEQGMVNIQFISKKGDKRFLTGAKKKGTFGLFGLYKAGMPIILTEGAATARTLYDILVCPVFFGIDAGNLTHALKTIITKYAIDTRVTKVTIAADYDINGVGEKAAIKALLDNFIAVNEESLIIPNFNVSIDWNDVSTQYKNGKEAIEQIFAAK